jgi:hypothetical protein
VRPTWRPLRRGVAVGASEAAAAAAGNTFDRRFAEAARSVVAEQLLERRGDAVKKGAESCVVAITAVLLLRARNTDRGWIRVR